MTISTPSFLICGLEHSGTTLASDLFREHPEIESGFECGVLLCSKPEDFLTFKPYINNMERGWDISKNDLTHACREKTFEGFYKVLFERSSIIKKSSPKIIFDKTPRYITQLKTIQSKIGVRTIALIKDPRSLALSDFKRSGKKLEEIDNWYSSWMGPKRDYMRSAYQGYKHAWGNNQCTVVRLEEICFNARETIESMFEFIELEFKLEYLDFHNQRYKHTSGSSININSCMQFMTKLPKYIQKKIEDDFSEFDRWFYNF
uniref:sulfotransferase n=1 Tax=Synechococcus sp. UW106 TaxID=368495 RepID=UPI000E0E2570|nr:sulfotransferase [Synechococcus sp. UW106]